MAKMTRKQYNRLMAENAAAIEALAADIARIIDGKLTAEYEGLNDKHDALTELRMETRRIESNWTTRNWTAGDWASYELVAKNID